MSSIAYIKFLFSATNEHGVHSPFVFSFLTKGLYTRETQWEGMAKKEAFIDRVFAYFKPKKVCVGSDKVLGGVLCMTSVSEVSALEDGVFDEVDLILLDEANVLNKLQVLKELPQLRNDAFVLVDRREKTAGIEDLWEALVESETTTVTLDFYYFGLAFVRREQLKQHFRLRM